MVQTLPSTFADARHHHRLLHGVVVERGIDRKSLKRLGLDVEPGEAGLEHHGEPQIAVGVGFEIERAGRKLRLEHRDRVFAVFAGLGIELAQKILDEIRIPDMPCAIGAHVMRRDGLARQVVFGDDDMRGAARGPRQGLQFVVPDRRSGRD